MSLCRRKCPGYQLSDIRCWMRCGLCLFALGTGAFLVKTYIAWDMWNKNYFLQYETCTEKYIHFKKSRSGDIFSDAKLHYNCALNAKLAREQSIHNVEATMNASTIHTMCSSLKPFLISHKEDIIRNTDDESMVVPNIVHYVSFNQYEWSFLNYLSLKSVDKNVKPYNIIFHGDVLPFGQWWQQTLKDVPNIYHVPRQRPERIQGKVIPWIEHSSDVIRIQTILRNGGIYLDTDIIVLKSFDPLRKYSTTLGRETSYGLGSGIILAEPFSTFLCVWAQVYRDYTPWPWHWALYAVWTPHRLAKHLADDIHIEEDTLHIPSWQDAHKLFKKTIDWSNKYAIHVWHRRGNVPMQPHGADGIDHVNSTLGEIMRFIFYGSKDIR